MPVFRARLVLSLGNPGLRQIYRRDGGTFTGTTSPLTQGADNGDPSASATGRVVAWDSDRGPDPGRQVWVLTGSVVGQLVHDPSGTSTNPALDGRGRHIAFQSRGDLVPGMNTMGASQVFVWSNGALTQVSHGSGDSGNAVFDKRARTVVFDSTTDPVTGADTGISQIWISALGATPVALTSGAGSSQRPAISSRSRFVAFESTADLAGNGADTGVPQIFAYDRKGLNFARVTNEPGGCTDPSIDETPGDFRVVFVCGTDAYLHRLRADTREKLPITGGITNRAIGEAGNFFVVVSTTADLINGGVTPESRIYQVNLFKLPTTPVAGKSATWFPDPSFRP